MSFILDALRRSERARRVLGAGAPAPEHAPSSAPRRGWLVGVALLLAVNAVLLAWFVLRPDAGPPPPAAVAAPGASRSLAREAVGTTAREPEDVAVAADVDAAPPEAARTDVIPLAELDPATRARFGALHLDAHGWAEDPAQRFVIIGLKRRAVGDALDGGARLVEIVADGAIVELEGRRVLLPRQ